MNTMGFRLVSSIAMASINWEEGMAERYEPYCSSKE